MTGVLASWAALDPAERKARCRALAGLAHVFAGPAAAEVIATLRLAEADPVWLARADAALRSLPAIPLRRTLSVLTRVL